MSAEQSQVLALLDFPTIVRCDDHEAPGLRCRDHARFTFRCKTCDELSVFCAAHAQAQLAAVVVHCTNCRTNSGRAAALFEVEPL